MVSATFDRKVDGVRPDAASYLQMIRAHGHAEDAEGGGHKLNEAPGSVRCCIWGAFEEFYGLCIL